MNAIDHRFVLKCLILATLLACRAGWAGPTEASDSPPDATPGPTTAPVPFLTGEEAIATMHLAPGFRMELVAEEPMVEHPVAMTFDGDGRMWVAEMRGYMPDAQATNERAPVGRISVLEDTDGDGRADKRTVFLDNLVLPKAISIIRDGVLVGAAPNLIFCRDTNGDGVCDQQTTLATDYGGKNNPENDGNGLIPTLDNWMYSASYPQRLKFSAGKWISDPIPSFGQFGVTQDNFGRLFHNSNSDHLRGSVVAPHYVDRNPNYRGAGANEQIAKDQTIWPSHGTVENRGYQPNTLRADGTLRSCTSACGPTIYRGGLFPAPYDNAAFICEVTPNVIKCDLITDNGGGVLSAKNAFDKSEFVASEHERFRPVNCLTGPDGALYVIDMHHGLIQHATHLTTYAKNQYLARELQKHLMAGRIYRILPDNVKPFPKPELSKAPLKDLIATLSHPNGWWRDTAQRLLVERGDFHAVPGLKKVISGSDYPLARLHALWTLEGLNFIDPATVKVAFADRDPKVRAAAIRVSEPILNSARRTDIVPALMKLASDTNPDVQLQFALTASPLGTPESDAVVIQILSQSANNIYIRDAAITGLRGRELEFLQHLLTSASTDRPSNRDVLKGLAECIATEGKPQRVAKLVDLISTQNQATQLALLEGFPKPIKGRRPRAIMLDAEPTSLVSLSKSAADPLKASIANAFETIHWPGQPGYVPPPPPRALTPGEQQRFESGKLVYANTCNQCHKPDGRGQEGLAPPLLDSEWLLGPESRPIRIVLAGLHGPIGVSGKTYNLEMPSFGALKDNDIAAVLTYVRRNWDHTADPVAPEAVKKIRQDLSGRSMPYTERELLKVK
jgi:mono/diheme cytochrome c family protein/glucose/arabinose dehydrogenase